jgi:polyketide synthase 12/polyene macrolide polyketide synthase
MAAHRLSGAVPALVRALVKAPRRAVSRAAAPVGGGLRDRLRELPPEERLRETVTLVTTYAAQLLGHDDAAAVDPGRAFLEQGFDSLVGVELRNKLADTLGVKLSASVVFDCGTPHALAGHLSDRLAAPAAGPVAEPGSPEDDSLERLFVEAIAAGRQVEAQAVLGAVARLRPTFTDTAELPELPRAVTLAEGPQRPRLIGISAPSANAGTHQYATLAAHFQGRRDVAALPLIGFAPGEPLPADSAAGVRTIAESVLTASGGHPFVLMGHSGGGAFAYAVAGLLEATWGIVPAGVVLLDTLSIQHRGDFTGLMRVNFADVEASPVRLTNTRLSAMGRWMGVLNELDVARGSAPVLEIQCARLLDPDGAGGPAPQRPPLAPGSTVRRVDADHLSLAREDAAGTADIVEQWLTAR